MRQLRLWPEADRIGVVSFVVDGYPAELVAQVLSAEYGIGVRDGRFCAHPLLERVNEARTAVRASVGLGSRSADVDRLVAAVADLRRCGPQWTYADGADGYQPRPDPRALPAWATSTAGASECR